MFSEDGSGSLGFEEFIDMLSVFSPASDRETKLSYIFRTYGHQSMLNACCLRKSDAEVMTGARLHV